MTEENVRRNHGDGEIHTDAAESDSSVDRSPGHVSRREVLKVAAASAAVTLINFDEASAQKKRRPAGGAKTGARTKLLFFSAAEFAMLDELTEMIIPTDDHSPGARAAGVAAYLDRRVGELNPAFPEYAKERQTWRDGLKMVNAVAQEMHGKTFMDANEDGRVQVLTRLAEQEPRPETPSTSARPSGGGATSDPAQTPPKKPDELYKEQGQNNPRPKEVGGGRKSEGEFFVFLKAQTARAYYTSEIGLRQELEYMGNQYLKEFVGYDADGNYTGPPKS